MNKFWSLAFCLLPLFTALIIPSDDSLWTTLSNHFFAFSAPVLIVCLFMWVLNDGTFDTFYAMWQCVGTRLFSPREATSDDSEPKQPLSHRIGHWYIKGLFIGSLWLIIAVIFWLLRK